MKAPWGVMVHPNPDGLVSIQKMEGVVIVVVPKILLVKNINKGGRS